MPSVIARSAIAPVFAQPSLRAEQVSQLVLGETGRVDESAGEWRRIRGDHDGYEGWVHAGYLRRDRRRGGRPVAAATRAGGASAPRCGSRASGCGCRSAPGWRCDGARCAFPTDAGPSWSRATCRRCGDATAGGPGAGPGAMGAGALRGRAVRVGRGDALGRGLLRAGADHLRRPGHWRCRATPRSRSDAARWSQLDATRPGDLLFFRGENGDRITHVAFAAEADTLIHSTVACGGVLMEPWLPGTRAAALRERLVAVRRLEER